MKKLLIAIAYLLLAILSLPAQNHRHNIPINAKSVYLVRDVNSMYEETYTIDRNVQTEPGIYGNIEKTSRKYLYEIPSHLSRFENSIIDSIMKGNTIQKLTWSWFIIWDTTFTKDGTKSSFSFDVIRNILFACILFLVFMWLVGYIMPRTKPSFMDSIFIFELDALWWGMGAVIGLCGGIPSIISSSQQLLPFAFIPYGVLLGYVLHRCIKLYRKYYPEEEYIKINKY